MSTILKNLNEKQIEAVKHISGPLLIFAGAGSGKTRTLTQRIAYLIQEKNINPWNILAVTFTNKAANEMKQRVIRLLKPTLSPSEIQEHLEKQSANIPLIGTFHAICVKILRKEIHQMDFENNFTIYDEVDQLAIVKQAMETERIDEHKINPKAMVSAISSAKNSLIAPEQYKKVIDSYFSEKVYQVYAAYQKTLGKNQALDFDDLIMKTIEIFQNFPKVLDKYQERFKFISVDEYQDTNHAQYILIQKLAEKYRNLSVIGDVDQSIYSWRGATMTNILSFEKDYPDAKIILLEQNYRSTKTILDAAHQVIVKNKNRKDKKMWTIKEGGEKIKLWIADNERHEGELIAREIRNRCRYEETPDFTQFVILYRANAQSRVLEETFMKNGIPYKIIGGVKFYSRKEIKDVLSYLRFIQNPHDDVSILRIINTPPRNIGPKSIQIIQDKSVFSKKSIFDTLHYADQFNELSEAKKRAFKSFLEEWRELNKTNQEFPAAGVIKAILHYTGYRNFLLEDGSEEGEIRHENIQELISVANKYSGLEPGVSLATFLEEVALITDLDQIQEKENAITMMTLHSAKGLEFDNVFIVGLEEGIFPHSRSLFDPEGFEEERRLMYVGMTRAKDNLYLLYAKERQLYGEFKSNSPSQFIDYINTDLLETNEIKEKAESLSIDLNSSKPIPVESPEIIELKDGDKVLHPSFGEGIVINSRGGVATIGFKNKKYGIKKFAISVAPLTKLS